MLVLCRYSYTSQVTLGLLFYNQDYICDTLERPWIKNAEFVSCIPEGEYVASYRENHDARIKKGYLITDVPNRTNIFIHSANFVDQLEGCIAVGVRSENSLFNSRETFLKLHGIIGVKDVLKIKKIDLGLCV